MPTVRLALLATVVAGGSIATGAYFAFRDDVFAGLVGRQTEKQITSEDQITALRAQVDRLTSQEFLDKERADRLTSQQSLDKERVEQRIKPLLQRQATLEQVTSELAKDPSIQHDTVRLRVVRSSRRRYYHPLKSHPHQSLRSRQSPRNKPSKQLSVIRRPTATIGNTRV